MIKSSFSSNEVNSLQIEPVISYPHEIEIGKSYLISIDVHFDVSIVNWPFEKEEYPLYFTLIGDSNFRIYQLGQPTVIVHRFGGSYGPASFVIRSNAEVETIGEIKIILKNQWLITIGEVNLSEIRIVEKSTIGNQKNLIRNEFSLDHSLPMEIIGGHNRIYQYFQVPQHATVASRYISFVSLIADKTENFVGRDFVFNAIDDFIHANESGYFLIEGEPGIGKTAILAELIKRKGYPHHFNVVIQNIRTPRQFLFNACAQLIARYNLNHVFIPEEAGNDSAFFIQCLEEAASLSENRPIVFVIDALDESEYKNLPLRVNPLYLPPSLPDGVFLILSSRVAEDLKLQVSKIKRLFLEPNSEGNLLDIRLYINSYLQNTPKLRKQVSAWKISETDFINSILVKSEGNFIYLHYILPDITQGRFRKGNVDELPEGLQAYYRGQWRQMQIAEPDIFTDLYEPILCILAVIKEPVAIEQIHLWTGKKTSSIRLAINKWREFLKESIENGEIKYKIYHNSFQEFLATMVDLKKCDQMIANYYLDKLSLNAQPSLLSEIVKSELKRIDESTVDIKGFSDAIVSHLKDFLKVDIVVLYLNQPIEKKLQYIAGSGLQNRPSLQSTSYSNSLINKIVNGGESYFTENASSDPILGGKFRDREKIKSSAYTQLIANDQLIGILFVNTLTIHNWTDEEKQMLREYGKFLADIIQIRLSL